MKTDRELQEDVTDAIRWEPSLKEEEINVAAKDGTITLAGTVNGYHKKAEAENAAKNVAGVTAVVENLDIRYSEPSTDQDRDIADHIQKVLGGSWADPTGSIRVKVEEGWVTLEGEVPWLYQKFDAKAVVGYITGVRGVTNNIVVASELHDAIEENDVKRAMERNWALASEDVIVKVDGSSVRLSGRVSSLFKKEKAESIASRIQGIAKVDNRLIVGHV